MNENDLAKIESMDDLDINSNNFMDLLIDSLSHDMYLGRSIYVGINELPFWIQRFIAQQKKNKVHAPIIWTMGESTTCEIEDRIEVYFKNRFPNVEVIALEANADIARELNEAFIEHGEYINSKKQVQVPI
jgi:ribosomal 50S subunit-recycling heat shock protein